MLSRLLLLLIFLSPALKSQSADVRVDSSVVCGFTIYPNPARENLTIVFDDPCKDSCKVVEIFSPLCQQKGKWVVKTKAVTLDLKDLWPDAYYVQVTINRSIQRKKLVREN